jgi:hypothetical protein
MPKHVAILISDGVSLRNFVYSDFIKLGIKKGWKITIINQSPINLDAFDLDVINLQHSIHPKTDLIKRVRKSIELKNFELQFKDDIYSSYSFPPKLNSVKAIVKYGIVKYYEILYSGERLQKLRDKIKQTERKSQLYKESIKVLKQLNPDLLFSTSQRSSLGIAPILASQELKIPTATFIYSWDNIPKATLVVEPDHYLVWSEYMKTELQNYYPYIQESQVYVTGTPQFEMHKNDTLVQTKALFYKQHDLDEQKDYICFSGDDITTSPHDPQYLEAVASAIRTLNSNGYNLGLIFRRCPVDFSDRYNKVLEGYKDEIVNIAPIWNNEGTLWNTIVPQKEDQALLLNTVKHCKLVINVGSSMIFDAVIHNTPCGYINYNPKVDVLIKDIHNIYKYVHFRSMPTKDAVIWLNSVEDILEKIKYVLDNKDIALQPTNAWFEVINEHPCEQASERIWERLKSIMIEN